MARRQDSGSNSSHENQRPNAHNEDRLPEFTDQTQGRGESDEEFSDEEDDEMDVEEDEADEGSY